MSRRNEECGTAHTHQAEEYLQITSRNLPVVRRILTEHGDESLSSYTQGLVQERKPSCQSRDDLFKAVQRLTQPLLGRAVAKQAVSDLEALPAVLTVNHHGVDSLAQSFQGNLIFSLNTLLGRTGANRTVPIFSCGSIPLNNLEYPRGLLLYHPDPERGGLIRRFPLFPDRYKRCMVSAMPGFNEAMLARAELTLTKMVENGDLTPSSGASLRKLLHDEYCAPAVIRTPSYSDQSVILNHRIWGRLFDETVTAPALVNVELEKLVAVLLNLDLMNEQSLAKCVLFDRRLRDEVLAELDQVKGCWRLAKLAGRQECAASPEVRSEGCGTAFFWGVDKHLKRVPLSLTEAGERLRGIDDRGHSFEVALTPKAIVENLNSGRLLPSLFTCFLTLSFARGVVCVGGYYQAEYLPRMQRGLVGALQKTSGYQDLSTFVAQVATDRYLSGMVAVMTGIDGGYLIPAGPVEVLAGGGITLDEIEQIARITVREAHLAGLFETVLDTVPEALRPPNWEKRLAKDCGTLLEGTVVIKRGGSPRPS